jgi:hypothetical protein
MTDQPPEISILDARLAEIDRRLSTIQTGLADDISAQGREEPHGEPAAELRSDPLPPRVDVPETPPPSTPAPPARPPDAAPPLVDQLRALVDAQERVLRRTQELLSAYERILARLPATPPDAPAVREFSVSAGPFSSTEALRGFEQTLEKIPEVREVSVRGYEGEDRAIVDVHLFEPNT